MEYSKITILMSLSPNSTLYQLFVGFDELIYLLIMHCTFLLLSFFPCLVFLIGCDIVNFTFWSHGIVFL